MHLTIFFAFENFLVVAAVSVAVSVFVGGVDSVVSLWIQCCWCCCLCCLNVVVTSAVVVIDVSVATHSVVVAVVVIIVVVDTVVVLDEVLYFSGKLFSLFGKKNVMGLAGSLKLKDTQSRGRGRPP